MNLTNQNYVLQTVFARSGTKYQVDSNGVVSVTGNDIADFLALGFIEEGNGAADGPIADAIANLYAAATLVTLDHTAGGTFVAGLGNPSAIIVTSDNAATIAGTTTIDALPGDLTAGWELVVTFKVISTTVAHTSIFDAAGGMALATSATAGQSFRYVWNTSTGKYNRIS